jgi:hypothetical protein
VIPKVPPETIGMGLTERRPASSTAWLYAQCRAADDFLTSWFRHGGGGSLPDTPDMRVQEG